MKKYLHVRYTDGVEHHENIEYRTVKVEDGVLKVLEKNNHREVASVKRGWPLVNIRTYWFSDWENR
jgi:hypothetical protein